MAKPPSFVKPRKQQLLPQDKLDEIVNLIGDVNKIDEVTATLEARLSQLNAKRYEILHTALPDILEAAGVLRVTTELYDVQLTSYYAANIPVSWPEERRRAAFDWLIDNGHGDLIKTEITAVFGKSEYDQATALLQQLNDDGVSANMKENINHNTLKSWLKEQVEKYNTIPPLDIIGGVVGRVAKIKEL